MLEACLSEMIIPVAVLWFYFMLSQICTVANSLQLLFGDCPIYYEEPCNTNMVKFFLTTGAANLSTLHQLNPFKVHLPENFDKLAPVKILIHGYGGLGIDKAIKSVRKAYHEIGYNVILVDWGPLSEVPCYATAYLNTWHVGQCIAILAVSLIPLGISPSSLHLIGFSLGAHIAGFAGANINRALKIRPARITGLDPALPFFATPNKEWKLDPSDAKFVDVVHTSAGTFGKVEALGHADFYMNGGALQPACYQAPYPPLCSHIMAGLYFAESIKNKKSFMGVQCDNIANYVLGLCSENTKSVMGEFTNKRIRGSFYVETSNSTPFALGYAFENFIFNFYQYLDQGEFYFAHVRNCFHNANSDAKKMSKIFEEIVT